MTGTRKKTIIKPWEQYNTKTKVYPNGATAITYCSHAIFNTGAEEIKAGEGKILYEKSASDNSESADRREDVYKRVKEKVFDIIYCNQWEYFLTITIDPKKMDSSSPSEVMKNLSTWLYYQTKHYDLSYILVPERFKKSNGIHAHALISAGDLGLEFSGRIRIGKQSLKQEYCDRTGIAYTEYDKIYNATAWPYGFSTAIKVSNNDGALSTYLSKYITKNADMIFGRYYWSSRNIEREPAIELSNTDFEAVQLPEFAVPNGVRLKYEPLSFSK